MHARSQNTARRGATLLELLVVVSILGLLMSLLLPAVQNVRQTAARTKCANNLREIGLALHHAHSRHGRLPPFGPFRPLINDSNSVLTWQALILPEMGHDPLWKISEAAVRVQWISHKNPPHVG